MEETQTLDGGLTELLKNRIDLCIHRQELFCITVSYLKLTKLLNSSKVMKSNLKMCALNDA